MAELRLSRKRAGRCAVAPAPPGCSQRSKPDLPGWNHHLVPKRRGPSGAPGRLGGAYGRPPKPQVPLGVDSPTPRNSRRRCRRNVGMGVARGARQGHRTVPRAALDGIALGSSLRPAGASSSRGRSNIGLAPHSLGAPVVSLAAFAEKCTRKALFRLAGGNCDHQPDALRSPGGSIVRRRVPAPDDWWSLKAKQALLLAAGFSVLDARFADT